MISSIILLALLATIVVVPTVVILAIPSVAPNPTSVGTFDTQSVQTNTDSYVHVNQFIARYDDKFIYFSRNSSEGLILTGPWGVKHFCNAASIYHSVTVDQASGSFFLTYDCLASGVIEKYAVDGTLIWSEGVIDIIQYPPCISPDGLIMIVALREYSGPHYARVCSYSTIDGTLNWCQEHDEQVIATCSLNWVFIVSLGGSFWKRGYGGGLALSNTFSANVRSIAVNQSGDIFFVAGPNDDGEALVQSFDENLNSLWQHVIKTNRVTYGTSQPASNLIYDAGTDVVAVAADYVSTGGHSRPFFAILDHGIVRNFMEIRDDGNDTEWTQITPVLWSAKRALYYDFKLWFNGNSSYIYRVGVWSY